MVFEPEHTTVSTLATWQGMYPADWHGAGHLVEPMRLVKDAWELAVFRRAGAALGDVAAGLGAWVAAGRTERDIAADINRAILRAGFSRPAFDTIVAAGPHSAHPHARPTDRRLESGTWWCWTSAGC